MSAILYYPKILPEVVFANPQVLLDKISELVFKSVEMEKLSKEQALSGEWIKFHDFALVTNNFLSQEVFKTHYVPGLFELILLLRSSLSLPLIANLSILFQLFCATLIAKLWMTIALGAFLPLCCSSLKEVQDRASSVLYYAG